MERPGTSHVKSLALLLIVAALGLSGCQKPSEICAFRSDAVGGPQRTALIIAADTHDLPSIAPLPGMSAELTRLRATLADLEFPDSNVCVLSGSRATLQNSRRALQEMTRAGDHAMRLFYFTGYGSEALDSNVEEPDERDETLVFSDANGSGGGELLDDELTSWLQEIARSSVSSLAIINAGFRARTPAGAPDPRYWNASLTRKISATTSGGDGVAGVLAPGSADHVAIARGSDASADRFANSVISNLARVAQQSSTFAAFASHIAAEQRVSGLEPEITGSGNAVLFGLQAPTGRAAQIYAPKLSLTLRDPPAPGGLEASVRDSIKTSVLSEGVTFADVGGDFELSHGPEGSFVLRGPDNRVRNRLASLDTLNDTLAAHRLQRSLLAMRGNGAEGLRDYSSLQVSLRETRSQPPCAKGTWDQAQPGAVQRIPLCHRWFVQVDLLAGSPPLYVEAMVLSSDGSSYLLPHDQPVLVSQSHAFDAPSQIFVAGPPLDVFDQVLVVGSTHPIDAQALRQGRLQVDSNIGLALSAAALEVVANDAFLESSGVTAREYTIKQFDIRPYMPDDDGSAVARFLRIADSLAKSSVTDGYSYKQHEWSKPTDAANLADGIDCSRAIWFAFTRSGQPYNRENRYLSTAEMVSSNSWMTDQFEHCDVAGDYQLGDILVYRSATKGDGHVVAVIDPEKRIAWGSHGWDGNVHDRISVTMDTGVEYQLIKHKTDWKKWDRPDMELKACWRYRTFAREREQGRSAPGSAILRERCGC